MALNTFKYREDWKAADGSKGSPLMSGFYLRGVNGSNDHNTVSVYGAARATEMFKRVFAYHPWVPQEDVEQLLEQLLGDTYPSSYCLQTRLAWALEASVDVRLTSILFTPEKPKKDDKPIRVYQLQLVLGWPATGRTPAEAQAAINLYQKYTALALDLQAMFDGSYITLGN